MSDYTYAYGLPYQLVQSLHLIIGALLVYVGYQLLNKKSVGQNVTLVLIVLGSLAFVYHLHLLYTRSQSNNYL